MPKPIDLEAMLRDAWLGIENSDNIIIPNALENMWNQQTDDPLMVLTDYISKSENFGFLCEHILNVHLLPYQLAFLQEMWNHKFPMFIACRGAGKSWLMGVYCVLRALLKIDTKTVVVGAGFRQSKVIYEYTEKIWQNAPVLRSMCKGMNQGPTGGNDRCVTRICDSQVIFLPLGTGDKIRGQRASCLIADEFASIQPDIFETVVVGFAATAANPYENVKEAARRRKLKELNLRQDFEGLDENQIIVSGTCDFDYQHFCRYWKRYRAIIMTGGDRDKLKEIFGEDLPENFNWKDYSIIRFPYELISEGFLDDTTISRARATLNTANYAREYSCVFPRDSEGFFRRSLVDSCVTDPSRPFIYPISGPVAFSSMLVGDVTKRYVMGIDPASETDNFAITIVELNEDHVKVVYAWTINREKHQQARLKNTKIDNNYYIFCANKIRDLMKRFNIIRISIDSQGGGYSVEEALRQTSEDVVAIYRIEDPDKPQDTDHLPGLHIIEMVNFASAEWVSSANHGMRKDFETRFLIFPYFDSLSLELAALGGDSTVGDYSDRLEDCIFEIEELKDELTTIVQTQTDVSGRERFSTPEIKLAGNKKGRLRKDRYSSLVMANMAARTILAPQLNPIIKAGGGFAKNIRGSVDHNANMYASAPEWFAKGMKDCVKYLGRSR
jgi:hypothetical protein